MVHDWDNLAKNWENNTTNTMFVQQVFQQLKTLTSLDGKHILDYGCGTGFLSQMMSPLAKTIVALDSSESMIEELDKKELPNVEPVVDSLTRGLVAQHPAFRKQFDLVVAASVCAYVDDFPQVVEIIYSLLDEGGLFIQWDWLADNALADHHLHELNVRQAFTQAGFMTIEVAQAFVINTPDGPQAAFFALGRK